MALTRRTFLSTLAAAPAIAQKRRTNAVFFMTDDHGPWATSATGCDEMHTPHIAALAQQGTRFTQAFACTPVCSPSRLTWFTGKIPSRHGVQDWLVPADSFGPGSRRFLDGHRTWSEVLAARGYTLGLAGKWHMGHDDQPHAGFQYWATVPGGGGPYRDPIFFRNGERVPMRGFKTDLVGDAAIEFLDRQKNSAQPFVLYMPFYAPHTPFNYQPGAYRAPYNNSSFSCFPRETPHPRQNPSLAQHHNNTESMRAYSALISGADANVGRVLDKLRQMGALEDTTVIFTADQGWNAGHHGLWGKGNGSLPFNMYDESIGVPLVWSHPGRIPQRRVESTMVSSYDFFSTLLDWLGVTPPQPAPGPGRSYANLLRGRRVPWRRDRLYFEYAGVRAVRTARWKYVARHEGLEELYDLRDDPRETRNLAPVPAAAAHRRALSNDLEQWFTRQGAPPLAEWRSTTKQKLPEYRAPGA